MICTKKVYKFFNLILFWLRGYALCHSCSLYTVTPAVGWCSDLPFIYMLENFQRGFSAYDEMFRYLDRLTYFQRRFD